MLVTGADSLETIAVYIDMLVIDFRVDAPEDLREHVRRLGRRYAKAVR